jgi:tetratricopeptide (TPR) repeat protein
MVEEIRHVPAGPRVPGALAALLPIVLIVWGFVACYLLQLGIDRAGEKRMREKAIEELMYFPSGQFIRQATIEYQLLAADVVWLRAVQYYGHHLMTDRKYEWLGHVFGILTTLDPKFIGAYHFGAMTLAWDARKPQEAVDFLAGGMAANPLNWQLPFDAGFASYMLLRDYERAGVLFDIASRLPDAWQITSRWAAVAMSRAGDFETARQMWREIYENSENKALRALVIRQLRNLKLEEGTAALQAAADRFADDRGRPPADLRELVSSGYVDRLPEEPYGGRFYLQDGKVRTTTPPYQRE